MNFAITFLGSTVLVLLPATGLQPGLLRAHPIAGAPEQNGEFMIDQPLTYVPEDWEVKLVDTETGKACSRANTASHTFSMSRTKAAPKEKEVRNGMGLPASTITLVIKSKTEPAQFEIRYHLATTHKPGKDLPHAAELFQNYSNPFSPVTTINYQIPKQSRVRLGVFDIPGRKVDGLIDEHIWTGNLASDAQLYRLQSGGTSMTRKFTLTRRIDDTQTPHVPGIESPGSLFNTITSS